jgi:hypothetical protein
MTAQRKLTERIKKLVQQLLGKPPEVPNEEEVL